MPLPLLSALLAVLQRLKLTSRRHVLVGSGGIAALTLLLRYLFSKDAKYISNLAKVGRLSASNIEPEEYDIIIVGGGMFHLLGLLAGTE